MNKYGNTVVVEHDYAPPGGQSIPPYALYAHLSRYDVRKGQRVSQGQLIARTGNTAGTKADPSHTFAPHLHFELLSYWPPARPDQYRVDPTALLDVGNEIPSSKTGFGLGTIAALGGLLWWLRRRRTA
jgi:murein DD-endopeptidase MepM/ murein hydrolase activator NlpD